jgi:hypothetical protein
LWSKRISHLIVPKATADSGIVFHRWSTHGSINLDLSSSAFTRMQQSGGDFPLVLYKVNFAEEALSISPFLTYSLEWDGVRHEFFQLLRVIDEGYNVRYLRRYEDRIDTAWVFDGEKARFTIQSPATPEQEFTVELQFVAAYGDKAPPQILQISQGTNVQTVYLQSGKVSIAAVSVKSGDSIRISNVFGCQPGTSFAPEDQDIRQFCYGLRDVIVRTTN